MIIRDIAALKRTVRQWKQAGETIGLVPTMGAFMRPSQPGDTGARPDAARDRLDFRQSDPVQQPDRPRHLSAHRGGRYRPSAMWTPFSSLPPRPCTPKGSAARSRSAPWPKRSKARTGPAISTAWRQSSPSSSPFPKPIMHFSGKKTGSNCRSSGASCRTSTCRSKSWHARPCARQMDWPCPLATGVSRLKPEKTPLPSCHFAGNRDYHQTGPANRRSPR